MFNTLLCCGTKRPVHDFLMLIALPIEVILIVMWGVTVALSLGDMWWIGWLLAAFALLIICTVLPIIIVCEASASACAFVAL